MAVQCREKPVILSAEVQKVVNRICQQYYVPTLIYSENSFKRRFQISWNISDKFLSAVVSHDSYFTQCKKCTEQRGLAEHQKETVALQMMDYGVCAGDLAKSLKMPVSTIIQSLKHFCNAVVYCFSLEYHWSPSVQNFKSF